MGFTHSAKVLPLIFLVEGNGSPELQDSGTPVDIMVIIPAEMGGPEAARNLLHQIEKLFQKS